jgi:hypothetical protein
LNFVLHFENGATLAADSKEGHRTSAPTRGPARYTAPREKENEIGST